MPTAYTYSGNSVLLDNAIKSGGEGIIFNISGEGGLCAKIYHNNANFEELEKKVLAMIENPPADPSWISKKHRSIAWPMDALYSDNRCKDFIGFLMPLIDIKLFREAHLYYDPADRIRGFGGGFTWKHLWVTAYNLVSSIASIHEKKHCVGDLRETNILVAPNSFITLIDCDSFQIFNKNTGDFFYTRVGTGEYLPPELMNISFSQTNINRYYSDLFALGIIIFKLLMNGVHPYQSSGKLVDDAPSIEAKIIKGYYSYEAIKDVTPPDYAPPYSILPPELQDLFYKCFVIGHKEPSRRPTALEWLSILKKAF